MEMLRKAWEFKWTLPIIGVVAGIGLGLLVGWVLAPVEWIDGTPEQMRADLRVDYLRMAIDSYSINRDVDQLVQRYNELGEYGPEALEAIGADPGSLDVTSLQNVRAILEGAQASPMPAEGQGASAGEAAMRFALPACLVTLLLGLFLGGALLLRARMTGKPGLLQFGRAQEEELYPEEEEEFLVEEEPEVETMVGREPLATFRTTYTMGNDQYDDTFSIESPAGDFLGECGVGIGDIIGMGEPKKLSAFEVWLFDKNDIQTVTKVLMSHYLYHNNEARNRLAIKGDPVLAKDGGILILETASLEVEARIVDMVYGESALPAESYFELLTIELRAYPRRLRAQPLT
jgi:hypothetical protein